MIPTMVIKTAITAANTGRSMKKWEIFMPWLP